MLRIRIERRGERADDSAQGWLAASLSPSRKQQKELVWAIGDREKKTLLYISPKATATPPTSLDAWEPFTAPHPVPVVTMARVSISSPGRMTT